MIIALCSLVYGGFVTKQEPPRSMISKNFSYGFKVEQQGRKIGTATYAARLTSTGQKVVDFKLVIGVNGKSSQVRLNTVHAPDGTQVKKYQETIDTESKRSWIKADLIGEKMQIVTDNGGTRETTETSVPKEYGIRATSEFWFIRDKVTPGSQYKYYSFSTTEKAWELVNNIYVKRTKILHNGEELACHLVETQSPKSTIKSYLDLNGTPIRVEYETMTLVRD